MDNIAPMTNEERIARIGQLVARIEDANRKHTEVMMRVPLRGLEQKEDGTFSYNTASLSQELLALSALERMAKDELVKLFADLFYDLRLVREWSAITLAMDIMRRAVEEVKTS